MAQFRRALPDEVRARHIAAAILGEGRHHLRAPATGANRPLAFPFSAKPPILLGLPHGLNARIGARAPSAGTRRADVEIFPVITGHSEMIGGRFTCCKKYGSLA